MSMIVEIPHLINGDIAQYGWKVLTGTGVAAASSGAGEVLKQVPMIGDWAGPIVGAGMILLVSGKSVYSTGDWARFSKDVTVGGVSMGAGVLWKGSMFQLKFVLGIMVANYVSACLASTGLGAPAALAITITSTVGTSLLSRWVLHQTPLGSKTKFEVKMEKKAIEDLAKINLDLQTKFGIKLDPTKTPKEHVR